MAISLWFCRNWGWKYASLAVADDRRNPWRFNNRWKDEKFLTENNEILILYTNITFAIQPISSATNCTLFKNKISLFSVRNFSSFQRLLNLHGFRRSSATARDAYFHPQFLQNQREIAKLISRTEHVPDTTDDGKVILFIKIDIFFRFFSFSCSCLFRRSFFCDCRCYFLFIIYSSLFIIYHFFYILSHLPFIYLSDLYLKASVYWYHYIFNIS